MCLWQTVVNILKTISDILMQLFRLIYHSVAQIISKFQINRTNSVANRTVQSCQFCIHHILRTALASLKILLYSIQMLLNLDLISFWATLT
ncbi:hypothetical protein O3M35_011828 [Rhynocoris fuscipes]|uniref:Uncharacterized protein n=1 Tax=Rhynocoris fuscipes TaxID=488301 RepID=A0AAW1CYY6_9HEMI